MTIAPTMRFGSMAHIEGQVLGKLWMSLAAFAFLYIIHRSKQERAA